MWGLLAFKPVWAVAFLLVPLLTRRWRFAAGMTVTGAALALATLPFTGVQPWFDWLKVGGIASEKYGEFTNWVFFSRDLIGIPRRYLLTFDRDYVSGSPYGPWPTVLGVELWASVPLLTALAGVGPAPRGGADGRAGGRFRAVGSLSSDCYHFMYYDVLLTVLPLALLFGRPVLGAVLGLVPWRPPLPLVVLGVLLLVPPVSAWLVPSHLLPAVRHLRAVDAVGVVRLAVDSAGGLAGHVNRR